jgi:hypothetical protein
LEERLEGKIFLIKEQQQKLETSIISSRKFHIDNHHKLEIKLAEAKGELKAFKEQSAVNQIVNYNNYGGQLSIGNNNTITLNMQINNYYQQLLKDNQQNVDNVLDEAKITATEEDKVIINQAIIFLGTEDLFVNYRQNTINKLDEFYCQLAKKQGQKRYTNFTNFLDITGKISSNLPNGSAVSAATGIVSDIVNLAVNFKNSKELTKCLEQFKQAIDQDQANIALFNENYHSLQKSIVNLAEATAISGKIAAVLEIDK